jgi:hypothetical protein
MAVVRRRSTTAANTVTHSASPTIPDSRSATELTQFSSTVAAKDGGQSSQSEEVVLP